jgi:hypothetical protein
MPHNGKRGLINLGPPGYFGGGFEFCNVMKMASVASTSSFSTNYGRVAPDLYDENGYPISTATHGAVRQIRIPRVGKRSFEYKVRWLGTHSLAIGGTSIGTATDYEGTFTPTGGEDFDTTYGLNILYGNINESDPPRLLEIFHVDDETRLDNGQVFQEQFLDRASNFGVIRDLLTRKGNSSLVALWEHEHNVDAISYNGARCPPGYYKGETTNVGNAYDITIPGFGFTHGESFVVRWSASASGNPTLSVNGGDDLSIYTNNARVPNSSLRPTQRHYSAVVYDANFGAFLIQNGALFSDYAGWQPGWPLEVFLDLCVTVGAHPWIVPRHLTLDTPTDHPTAVATMVKDYVDNNTWMHPIIEACANESWNSFGFFQSVYGWERALDLWPANGSQNHNEYIGRVASLHGAVWDSVFNDQSKYDFVVGVQYNTTTEAAWALNLGGSHVSVNGGTPADNYVTHAAPAIYYGCNYTAQQELDEAWLLDQVVGDEAKQAYVDALVEVCPARAGTSVNYLFAHWQPICADTEKGLYSYEGTGSFDFPTEDTTATVTGITNAAQAVVTLASGARFPPDGSLVSFSAVTGMDGIDAASVTFSGSASANINGANFLALDQRVRFIATSGTLPSEIVTESVETNYYVVSAGNPFQISATEGGSAITFASAGAGTYFVRPVFEVLSSNRTTRQFTLDVDTTGLDPYTSGGTMTFRGSMIRGFELRSRFKFAPALADMVARMFTQYTLYGGRWPATFALNSVIEGVGSTVGAWEKMESVYETPVPEWDGIVEFSTSATPLKIRLTTS